MAEQPIKPDRHRQVTVCLSPGEYALVATLSDDIRLYTPGFNLTDTDVTLSNSAIVLIALAEKLNDDEWVGEFVQQYVKAMRNT